MILYVEMFLLKTVTSPFSSLLEFYFFRQTHSQTVVRKEAGDAQASLNRVWLGLGSWEQRVQAGSFAVGQLRLRLGADVQVLGLESRESPQAVTDLVGGQDVHREHTGSVNMRL